MVYTDGTKVYNRSGLTSSEIDLTVNTQIIQDAEAELEMITERKFTNAISITEYLDGPKENILLDAATTVFLSNYPVLTITSFLFLNNDGTTNTTLATLAAGDVATADYWMSNTEDTLTNKQVNSGKITMKAKTIPVGTQTVKVIYTYGYATVPRVIENLATCLAGIRAWVQFMGGQYNRFNNYSVPQQNVNKGDFYQRAKQMIDELTQEANRLLDRIGRGTRILAFGTGGS